MTERPRRLRTRNGLPPEPDREFYCKLCSKYMHPLAFENDKENPGACLACAFKLAEILAVKTYMPGLDNIDHIRMRKRWGDQVDQFNAVKRFRAGSNEPGWVYYIAQDDLIKIGYSVDVAKRMRAYPPTAKLLAVHPGTLQLEKQMHTRFTEDLARGREWFNRSDELLQHIDSVVSRFGEPSLFEYQYSTPKTQEEKVRALLSPTGNSVQSGARHVS